MIKVGIAGVSGYMGGEVLRILLSHPEVQVAWVTSRKRAPVEHFHPNLYGCGLHTIDIQEITACDLVFNALPLDETLAQLPRFRQMGCKVIDLGAALRLNKRDVWERVYAKAHPQWELVQDAVYGITELHQAQIARSELVANPGCFSSAAILGLAPLAKSVAIDSRSIVVTGISGTAGAGAELSRAVHHAEIGANIVAYNVVDHRHSYEMEQELSALAQQPVTVHFTPVYAPIVRGILCLCSVFTSDGVTRETLLDMYREYYRAAPFVQVYDLPKEQGAAWQYQPYPWISSVAGTNQCFIGLDIDSQRGRVLILSVLDSLGKGGAQVGVENMNIMFGFNPALGLSRYGLHP